MQVPLSNGLSYGRLNTVIQRENKIPSFPVIPGARALQPLICYQFCAICALSDILNSSDPLLLLLNRRHYLTYSGHDRDPRYLRVYNRENVRRQWRLTELGRRGPTRTLTC